MTIIVKLSTKYFKTIPNVFCENLKMILKGVLCTYTTKHKTIDKSQLDIIQELFQHIFLDFSLTIISISMMNILEYSTIENNVQLSLLKLFYITNTCLFRYDLENTF